ncbi:hypothetical protein [Pseudomonas sp. EA_35y_Pfl2_R5]|uniref:hypothetical protein n=1 Tax=Pseudomonas sp. EA_35y_Pfl2_R5 TaxID=3088690 RepID=UPI0030D745D5
MRILPLVFVFLAANVQAECWQVGDLKGVTAKSADKYSITEDGMSKKMFLVNIKENASSIIPSSDLECLKVSNHSMTCIYPTESKGTVETWAVDPANNIAYYTKSVSGFGIFDGPTMLVGKILGMCE